MSEYVYLYTPRSDSPSVYRSFDDAYTEFLLNNMAKNTNDLILDCEENGVWFDIDPDNETAYIDDGGYIEKVELR